MRSSCVCSCGDVTWTRTIIIYLLAGCLLCIYREHFAHARRDAEPKSEEQGDATDRGADEVSGGKSGARNRPAALWNFGPVASVAELLTPNLELARPSQIRRPENKGGAVCWPTGRSRLRPAARKRSWPGSTGQEMSARPPGCNNNKPATTGVSVCADGRTIWAPWRFFNMPPVSAFER